MSTGQRRSALSYIPGYKNNAVLQLIIFSLTAYITLGLCWGVTLIVYAGDTSVFNQHFAGNLALGPIAEFKNHFWTIFTYGFFQVPNSFMELLSSMLWLYCFGSVVQMLVGHRQIIPLYIYCLFVGGAAYMAAQLLPGNAGHVMLMFFGARAGLMGMAVAAVTLSPDYRFYLTETFSIPLMLVAGVFAILMVLGSGLNLPILFMLLAGGLMGYAYIRLLRSGYRPGAWMYSMAGKIDNAFVPANEKVEWKKNTNRRRATASMYEAKHGIPQSRIDEILDKINQKGYNSLSKEEKEALLRAGKDS